MRDNSDYVYELRDIAGEWNRVCQDTTTGDILFMSDLGSYLRCRASECGHSRAFAELSKRAIRVAFNGRSGRYEPTGGTDNA